MLPFSRRRVATVGLALASALGLLACGGTASPRLPPARSTPLLSIFESEGSLHADPAGTLATLRALGANTLRVYVPWGAPGVEGVAPDPNSPTPPAGFNGADPTAYPAARWAPLDRILLAAAHAGMRVDLTVGAAPPLWARGPGDPGTGTTRNPIHPQWRPDRTQFGRFMRALGHRYGGQYRDPVTGRQLPRVSFWAIWNEPNFGPDLAPQAQHGVATSPAIYRGLVDAAWAALGATGHGHDTVLIGELAPYGQALGSGPGSFGYTVPLEFLRTMYCVGGTLHALSGAAATAVGCPATPDPASFRRAHPALFGASGLSLHPYSQGPPAVSLPGEPDYANLAALPKVEHTIDGALTAWGSSRRLPLYLTEFGIHTDPPETVPGTDSPARAAADINQAEYLSWRDPRVRSVSQYLLQDGPTGVFATGLIFSNGQPKPTLDAYRMPLYLPVEHRHGTTPLQVWGAVRPARYAKPSFQRVSIEFRAPGAAAFHIVRTVPLTSESVYFDVLQRFDSAGAVRTAWRGPSGSTYYSRTVQITSS